MAWYDNMMVPLRVLINDLSEPYTYTDETLQKLLVTAASQVQQELSLSEIPYTISYSVPSITPDPSSDTVFVNFTVMKAACLKNQWDFNASAVSSGVRAKCGPVSMEKVGAGSAVLVALLNDGFCAAYEQMKLQYNFGDALSIRAVLTPFNHSEISIPDSNGLVQDRNFK